MKKAEMTDELKRDLKVIRMRNYLDPKRFYKSADATSKFVQVGTVKDGPMDRPSGRLTKKQRKQTLVDELLVGDEKFRDYSKRQYLSIQDAKRSGKKADYAKHQRKRKPKWST
ncbi:unnamed protein product [Choristocarpus tenellus]